MGDVLGLATSGIKKTHIMYRANLSYEQVHLYLGELIGKRLIAQDVSSSDGVVYRTTTKGREFLLYYTRLVEFLEEEEKQEPEVELSAHHTSADSRAVVVVTGAHVSIFQAGKRLLEQKMQQFFPILNKAILAVSIVVAAVVVILFVYLQFRGVIISIAMCRLQEIL